MRSKYPVSHAATVRVSEVNGCVIFSSFLFSLVFQFHVVWYIVTRTALPLTSQTQLPAVNSESYYFGISAVHMAALELLFSHAVLNGQCSVKLGDIIFSPVSFILDKSPSKDHPLRFNITFNLVCCHF